MHSAYYSMLDVHCSLLTTHFSLQKYSLLTAHTYHVTVLFITGIKPNVMSESSEMGPGLSLTGRPSKCLQQRWCKIL